MWLDGKFANRPSRVAIPNGMTRKEANVLWERAERQAQEFIKMLEENGVLPKDEDEDQFSDKVLAKAGIKEVAKYALGPISIAEKAKYLRILLDFTKAKPVSKSEIAVSGPEEWLMNAIAENERNK